MIKINIIRQNQITNSATFAAEIEADQWLAQEIANGSFGKSERWVAEESPEAIDVRQVLIQAEIPAQLLQAEIPATFDEAGNVLTEAIPSVYSEPVAAIYATEYLLPAEFEIEKIDITIEHNLALIRAKRSALLAETDYTQLPDSPLSAEKKAQYAAYRQALRDIPSTMNEQGQVVWPEKP